MVVRPAPRRVIVRRPWRGGWWGPWWWTAPRPAPLLPSGVSPVGEPVARTDPWCLCVTTFIILLVVVIIVATRRQSVVAYTYSYSYDTPRISD